MTRKRKLSNLIQGKVTESKTNEITESITTEVRDLQTDQESKHQSNKITDSQTSEVTELEKNSVPKYLTLVRKEARLRDDQLEQLTFLTRKLNRQRQGQGERITENTLIRIAVDLLLTQSDKLQGITEEELTTSLN